MTTRRQFSLMASALAAGLLATPASAQTVLRSTDIHPTDYPTVEAVRFMGQLLDQRGDAERHRRTLKRIV